jgi:hypothetical protein
VGYKVVEENFNPAMGFVNNAGIEDLTGDLGYAYFFKDGPFQNLFSGLDAQRIKRLDGGLQSEVLNFRVLELETTSKDRVNFSYRTNKEVILNRFAVFRQAGNEVYIEPGVYSFNEQLASISTGGQREFSGFFSYRKGNFFNGDRLNLNGKVAWNQSRYFILSMGYDWNDIELPQGDFTTRLVNVSSQIAFSPNLYWISLVQYDNISEEIGINTRLQWIPRAGQEGFIVLNYGLQDFDRDNSFETLSSNLSLKFRYTFRF